SNHNLPFYLSKAAQEDLNRFMKSIKVPGNLPRTIRPLSNLSNYKASEWNSFLLFIFPVVMKKDLLPKYYEHFFKLTYSMAVLLKSHISISELNLSNRVLNKFVN